MVGGNTIDKRRPDLRDELGYIAPPNRKLPPVPGSNYNTCDRIKRGTAISKRQHDLRLQLMLLSPCKARSSHFFFFPFTFLLQVVNLNLTVFFSSKLVTNFFNFKYFICMP